MSAREVEFFPIRGIKGFNEVVTQSGEGVDPEGEHRQYSQRLFFFSEPFPDHPRTDWPLFPECLSLTVPTAQPKLQCDMTLWHFLTCCLVLQVNSTYLYLTLYLCVICQPNLGSWKSWESALKLSVSSQSRCPCCLAPESKQLDECLLNT